jgi:Domain of unknown function (DUF4367)
MNELERQAFEKRLISIASRLEYPRTPDVAGSVTTRLLPATRPRFRLASKAVAWSLTIILVLCSSLMLIPPARAAIIEFIQIGIVRIFPRAGEPTPESTSTPPSLPQVPLTATPFAMAPVTATPAAPSSDLIPVLGQIAGETSLADAQKRVSYPILLPTHPPDLGEPDYVFVQDADGLMTILVWLDPQHADRVLMSLHFIPAGSWQIDKTQPQVIDVTRVHGGRAIWVIGPYPLRLYNGELEFTRLIMGHVLIWEQGDITYRLETDLSMEEAVKIAESLQPIP